MSQLRYGLVIGTALVFVAVAPVSSRAAEENAATPTASASNVRTSGERTSPVRASWSRAFPTPEESRAALLQPIPTQPSLGDGPVKSLPAAETNQHQDVGKQQEFKNTIGGPQGTGANANHPQWGDQALGQKPSPQVTSGSGGADKKAPVSNDSTAAGGEPAPWGPIGAVGQTIPAKIFARNDVLDRTPIMAFPLRMSDEERRKIFTAVMADNAPAADGAEALEPSSQLSTEQALQGMHPLPDSLQSIAQVQRFKYVKSNDKVLLVEPATRIVVDQIKG